MPIKHLYIDSRFRIDGGSDSDFTVSLPETINLPPGARCVVSACSFANVFYTIEENVNNRLYMLIETNGVTGAYIFPLVEGNYGGEALAAELTKWLVAFDAACQISYNKSVGKIRIFMSLGINIKIVADSELTDPALQTLWNSFTHHEEYDRNNIRSVNEVFKVQKMELSPLYISELLQLNPFHTLYLHSGNLVTYDSLNVTGQRSIIARIPVTAAWGYVVHHEASLESAYFDVSDVSFRNLSFSLRNARGNVVPLHGTHLSLVLTFD